MFSFLIWLRLSDLDISVCKNSFFLSLTSQYIYNFCMNRHVWLSWCLYPFPQSHVRSESLNQLILADDTDSPLVPFTWHAIYHYYRILFSINFFTEGFPFVFVFVFVCFFLSKRYILFISVSLSLLSVCRERISHLWRQILLLIFFFKNKLGI